MSSINQIVLLFMVFVATVGVALGLMWLLRPNPTRQRLQTLVDEAAAPSPSGNRWLEVLAQLTRPVSKLAAPEEGYEYSAIKLKFVHAGIRHPAAPAAYFGVKAVLALGLPVLCLGLLSLSGTALRGNGFLFVMLVVATLGYYLPNGVLHVLVSHRQREIFENFPDALDLLTVCVEAGLGTEAGLMRVAKDFQFKSPALSDELRLVNLELRAGADRERALRNLAIRTGVDEVDGFVTMITQAERFGTSVAASLRIQSEVLRTRRRQKAEEAAAKIALKLLFPLMFCIFPALMVVLMGPAMIQVYRVLLPTMGGTG